MTRNIRLLLLVVFVIAAVRCHCPHMMGIKTGPPAGPSPPGKLPEGDEGWDYDESAAPGIVPDPHFIQSTYVYRAANVQEKKFAERVVNVLKEIRSRLSKSARLTLENENIECSTPDDHFRCREYPTSATWHYLIVEDQAKGAVTYTFERKFNEKNDGTIEMALLDAFSRHSPSSLIAFASPEAEKEVGYIREVSTAELNNIAKKPAISIEKFGINELNLVEKALLEVRTGANLNLDSEFLQKIDNSGEFDKLLEKTPNVFVLFWNKNRMVSLHTFNLFSRVAEKLGKLEDTVLGHVACHENSDFCHGLESDDFHTVVAYRNGQNVGKTDQIGDVDFYENWIELILAGGLHEISDESEISSLKKGIFGGKKRNSVTIGVFPSKNDGNFKHFQIAAEKLAGKYYLTYFINERSSPAVTTYKYAEKQKRLDYSGKFDPASLMEFISKSSLPNIFNITTGFTTDLLLRQKRPILLSIGKIDNEPFLKLAARKDARKSWNFAKIQISEKLEISKNVKKALEILGVEEEMEKIVLINKDRINIIPSSQPKCPDHLLKILQNIEEAEKVLSTKEAHPLRYLQLEKVNQIFGPENSIVLPDHTLFLDSDPFSRHPPVEGATGGCPFMQGGAPQHTEL